LTLVAWLVIGYAIASRLAYVLWVGNALRRQDREQFFTRTDGGEAGFRRFRDRATMIMRNDAFALVLVCIVTRNTLDVPISTPARVAISIILIILGLGTKAWAAKTLGDAAYYWHNFFVPREHVAPDPPGPYRYLDNPMYTVGYLHAYGLALALASAPGLAVVLFAHVAILAFHFVVEKPHYDRITAAS
jgi:protein-S-isoprenylcysteine O-methyltransferase Ste14